MKVGDLVKVIAEGLRPQIDGIGLVTKMRSVTDNHTPPVLYCWALMADSGETYKFRVEHMEVISAS